MKGVAVGRKKRTSGLDVGATQRQEQLIRRAAKTSGVTVSDLMLESACLQAEHALADKREFIISQKQWEASLEVLDRPARMNLQLTRLLRSPLALSLGGRQ